MVIRDEKTTMSYMDSPNHMQCSFCSKHNRRIPCYIFIRSGSCKCAAYELVKLTSEFCPICIGESKPRI